MDTLRLMLSGKKHDAVLSTHPTSAHPAHASH
jgi:hypothetical protein